jgi:hypothetical protein
MASLSVEVNTVLPTIKKPGLFDHPLTAQDRGTMNGMDVATPTRGTTTKTTTLITSFLIKMSTLVVHHKSGIPFEIRD